MNRNALSILIVTALIAWGCAGTTATEGEEAAQSAAPEQAADAYAKDPDELLCKRIQKTGSMRKTKVCATREEWEAAEEDMTDWRDGLDSF